MASNCRMAMAPLVSVSRTWSTLSPISPPGSGLPATRWVSINFLVRLNPMGETPSPSERERAGVRVGHYSRNALCLAFLEGNEAPPAGALVVRARADQPVVVVLLEQIRGPARDARDADHGREEIERNPDGVEERRRVEVHVGDQLLGRVDLGVELHGEIVPEALAGLPAGLLGHALQDGGARVACRVDAMTEAHETALLRERLVGEGI